MNLQIVEKILDVHGIKFVRKTGKNGPYLQVFCYFDAENFDIISEHKIISGNIITKLTLQSLKDWLGY